MKLPFETNASILFLNVSIFSEFEASVTTFTFSIQSKKEKEKNCNIKNPSIKIENISVALLYFIWKSLN